MKKLLLFSFLCSVSITFGQGKNLEMPLEIIKKLQTNRNITPIVMETSVGKSMEYKFKEVDNGFPTELKKKYPEIRVFEGVSVDNSKDICMVTITNDRIFGTYFMKDGGLMSFSNYKGGGSTSKFEYKKEERLKFEKCGDCNKSMSTCSSRIEDNPTLVLSDKINNFKDIVSKKTISDSPTYSRGNFSKEYRFALSVTYAKNVEEKNTTLEEGLAYATSKLANMNRVLGLELSVRLKFVPNEDLLIFLTPDDPFPDEYLHDSSPLLDMNQKTIDRIIGNSNYDWGFVLFPCWISWASSRGSECSSQSKAKGVSDSDALILHEMGHQLGCPHAYHLDESDEISRITTSIVGSNGGRWFHSVNFEKAARLVDANPCGKIEATGNTIPIISIPLGDDLAIPKLTPFVLTGFATDPDSKANLTYTWQQAGFLESEKNIPEKKLFFAHLNPTSTNNIRYVPDLKYQIENIADPSAILPNISRDVIARFIVRDNQEPFGSTVFKEVHFKVDDTAGPFLVTFPNTSMLYFTGDQKITVTWDVANTNNSLVNTQLVNILLSLDHGVSWNILASRITNNGSHEVILPNMPSKTARIKVEPVGNIFNDISDNDFEIVDKAINDFIFNQYNDHVNVYDGDYAEFKFKFTKVGVFKNKVNVTVDNAPIGSKVVYLGQLNESGDFTVSISNIRTILPGKYPMKITLMEQGGTGIIKSFDFVLTKKSVGDDYPGNSLSLNTNSQYAAVATIPEFKTNNFTICAWVKPKSGIGKTSGIVYLNSSASNSGTGIMIEDNQLYYHYNGSSTFSAKVGPILEIDKWSHIALVIEPEKSTFYVNGKASPAYIKTHKQLNSPDKGLYIGRGNGYNFKGEIDEVKIFNKSLSAIEIQEQVHKTINYNDDNLLAYYQFNESTGNAISPVSYNNGIIIGEAKRVISTIPVGNAIVKTLPKTEVLTDFGTSGVKLQFLSNNVSETSTVHKINVMPYNLEGISDEDMKNINGYWEINNYPVDTSKIKMISFKYNKDIKTNDNPSNYSLYTRNQTSDGKWKFLSKASSINDEFDFIVFKDISDKGQFIVTKTDKPLGIDESIDTNNSNLMIYKNSIQKTIIDTGITLISSIRIYDLRGRLLFYKDNVNNSKQEVDLLIYRNQMLIAQVNTMDNKIVSKKFMN